MLPKNHLLTLQRFLEFIQAPIPSWVQYDKDQQDVFESKENVEKYFVDRFGTDIEDLYVNSFEQQLNDMMQWVADWKEGRENIKDIKGLTCTIAWFGVKIYPTSLCLEHVHIRPCAERMGVFRIILFVMLRLCKQYKYALQIECPLHKTKLILLKISNLFVRDGHGTEFDDWILPIEAVESLTIDSFGIRDILDPDSIDSGIKIIKERWPSAENLNNQQYVDARKTPIKIEGT